MPDSVDLFDLVSHFNRYVLGIPQSVEITRLEGKERAWMLAALREELTEYSAAESRGHEVDALLDLVYFAIGGLYRMGLTPGEMRLCFRYIHEANMRKKLGAKATRPHSGDVADAVKPEGWRDPVELIQGIISSRDS